MDTFYALAEPKRRSIVEMLSRKGQLSASEISTKFHVSPPAISQHLKVLREANIVYMEKRAQQRLYKINLGAIAEIEHWAKDITQRWNARFDALDKMLKSLPIKPNGNR